MTQRFITHYLHKPCLLTASLIFLLAACRTTPGNDYTPVTLPSAEQASETNVSGFDTPIPARTPPLPPFPVQSSASPDMRPLPEFLKPEPDCHGCGYIVETIRAHHWSPDSKQLAYQHETIKTRYQINQASSFDLGGKWTSYRHQTQLQIKGPAGQTNLFEQFKKEVAFYGWSPDGNYLLLGMQVIEDRQKHQIFISRPNGSELRALSASASDQLQPIWSKDGQEIVFLTSQPRQNQFWIEAIQADGSQWRKLQTYSVNHAAKQLWDAQGNLMFIQPSGVSDSGWSLNLKLHQIQPEAPVNVIPLQIESGYRLQDFSPSPDGKLLAYTQSSESDWRVKLMLANRDGSSPRQIQQLDKKMMGTWEIQDLNWSPDSRWLSYSQLSLSAARAQISDIYRYELTSSQITQLTHADKSALPIENRAAVWSPDGQRLAFLSSRDVKFKEVQFVPKSLYSMNLNGEDLRLEVAGSYAEQAQISLE